MRILSYRGVVAITVFLLSIIFSGIAWAQKDTGSIVGTVKDRSGAVVANAKISVTDVERDQTFATNTDSNGEYVASPLRVGKYTVTAEREGFKKAFSTPVDLESQI